MKKSSGSPNFGKAAFFVYHSLSARSHRIISVIVCFINSMAPLIVHSSEANIYNALPITKDFMYSAEEEKHFFAASVKAYIEAM